MNKNAYDLAMEMAQLSEQIGIVCDKKAKATTQKEQEYLETEINKLERNFHDIKDVLKRTIVNG